MIKFSRCGRLLGLIQLVLLPSCGLISETGPVKGRIREGDTGYRLVEVKTPADVPAKGRTYGRADQPPPVTGEGYSDKVRVRDTLSFVITDLSEQSPFYSRGEPYRYGPIEVPGNGIVEIPYVGEINVLGREPSEISAVFSERIRPISGTAQASVARTGRFLLTANVMGQVKKPGPIPLERKGLSSLDLLAAAGGTEQAEHLYGYTLRRAGRDYHFDYQGFRRSPFPVEAGDLLTVAPDNSNRFHVMGAINRPISVAFPIPSPTLADALGASTGLDERRSDPSGVFVFRKGDPDTVYTFDLKDPNVIPLVQRFPIQGEDIVYVTEAPLARWNRLLTQVLPIPVSQAANAAWRYSN